MQAKRMRLALAVAVVAVLGLGGFIFFGQGTTADTKDTVFRDPRDRTEMKLEDLEVEIRKVGAAKGALPQTLAAVVLPADSGGPPRDRSLAYDAWGRRIMYMVSEDRLILRSAGPDGIWETADDVVRQGVLPKR